MFLKLFKIRNNLFYVSIIFFLQIGLPLNKILADDIYIAVASNFLTPLNSLKKSFETQNKTKIFISSGSSGSLYSQIINGAPLDIFLSGDQKLPKKIEFSQKGIKGSRFTYATGKLLIFTTNKFLFDKNFPQVLTSNNVKYIPSRLGEARISLANVDKIYKTFAWKPQQNLEEWVKKQIGN